MSFGAAQPAGSVAVQQVATATTVVGDGVGAGEEVAPGDPSCEPPLGVVLAGGLLFVQPAITKGSIKATASVAHTLIAVTCRFCLVVRLTPQQVTERRMLVMKRLHRNA